MVAAAGSAAVAQGLPAQARYSTHDNTQPVPAVPPLEIPANFQEWMVDTKTPGDGRIYSAGTITVNRTRPAPTQFSGEDASPSAGLGFDAGGTGALNQRQIGILQIVDAGTQDILQQRYFYGDTGAEDFTRATNVRGISVWPTGIPGTTRIAICGETYDETLPLCASTTSWSGASATNSGGFIAVYDGNAALLWTYHFFGGNVGSSAVTDLSIRVDDDGNEIVTYCGISSHGNPAANGTLGDVAAFGLSLPSASGSTDNGSGQWDGFVGRLVRDSSGTTNKVFHAVVGGAAEDGLFGLAEIDEQTFVVVGSTGLPSGSIGGGTPTFPGLSATAVAPYAIGVSVTFTFSGGALLWDSALQFGNVATDVTSIARDVVVQPRYESGFFPLLAVVGSTNDPGLLAQLTNPLAAPSKGPQQTFGGLVDGWLVTSVYAPGGQLPVNATFRGGDGVDYLTGIGAWNEFTDYLTVVGVVGGASGNGIDVGSYLIDTDSTVYFGAPLVEMVGAVLDSSGDDHPTAIGDINTTTLAVFPNYGLGDPQGGGVAVDDTARVNVVGTTDGANYPVSPAGPTNFVFGAGRPKTGIPTLSTTYDATRTVLDLLPARPLIAMGATPGAVGRTDGTGQLPAGTTSSPALTYPMAGVYGGTTPECSLLPFGFQIGVAPAVAVPNKRMFIGCDVLPVSGGTVTLYVSRPPASFGELSAWQVDFPGVPAPPVTLPGGAIVWITGPSVTFAHFSSDSTLTFLLTLPPGSATLSVQLLSLPLTPVTGVDPILGTCTGTSDYVASPALWLNY